MLKEYKKHVEERSELGIVPKPLDAKQTSQLVQLLKEPMSESKAEYLLALMKDRIPSGVNEAAYVKVSFLDQIVKGQIKNSLIDKKTAVEFLGIMHGGYNISPLIDALEQDEVATIAAQALGKKILLFDSFDDIKKKSDDGNDHAIWVMKSWADGNWFTNRPVVKEKITLTVFRVPGETNTDDLSPAQDAWSRPDIPLHSLSMLKNPRHGFSKPIEILNTLKKNGHSIAYVGDVIGTGSSRKSATNSIIWHIGHDIPGIPNKRFGGYCFGGKISPIFFNTMKDSGALPIEMDISKMKMGDLIDLYPYAGKVLRHETNEVICEFKLRSNILLDEVRSGGRINLIIGRDLTYRARNYLGLGKINIFIENQSPIQSKKGYTLAQKMVGRACGLTGVRSGQYCEPEISTVGSQDTTGPMTRDELEDLACLEFQADLVMQSFCHTSAYPKRIDLETQYSLPKFMVNRGGISIKPGDGIIHSWMNRMLLPDTVGTGGDSHTRFPIGISFPAGSGLVAFAAATGVMPLDMPESVLVRFTGHMQPGITMRDLVHSIPYAAIQKGSLTVEKRGKKNVYSGRILEIEGLPNLKVEQAFELSNASAERSAAGCTIKLNREPIFEYLHSNIVMLKWMIRKGYSNENAIRRRITSMERWLENPDLLEADKDAEYVEIIDIDVNTITEPILCAPNDPDDARLLSEVSGVKVEEVFIGSCMTNIGHFRAAGKIFEKMGKAAPTRIWIVPPTKMDKKKLMEEGFYSIFSRIGARTENPGCSLCMGNQARVTDHSTVVSTSTRNFPNRLGKGASVYLASSEICAVAGILGKLPTVDEYFHAVGQLSTMESDIYRYLNFNDLDDYQGKSHENSLVEEESFQQ